MKRIVMVLLPCIIMLVLIWGYVPAAREMVNKFEKLSSDFKINNLNQDSAVNSKNEQIKKENFPSVIVENEKKSNADEQEKSNIKTTVYRIARQYNGKLGIFLPDTPLVPERIIDVEISSLPPEDKKMFEKGLLINSQTQLANLIEDYTS